jgi:hypothetical protein
VSEDWGAYFRKIREDHARAEAEATATVESSVSRLVGERHSLDVWDLWGSPKKVANKAMGLDWVVQMHGWTIHSTDDFYANDGENGKRGDLKKAAHDTEYQAVEGIHPSKRIAFLAEWKRAVSPSTGKSTYPFQCARILDPLGVPVELRADYSYGKDERKAYGLSIAAAQELQYRREGEYNDGKMYLEKRPMFTTATPFNTWLEDWVALAQTAAANAEETADEMELAA